MNKKIEVGTYIIEWIDQDHVLVTKKYSEDILHTAKITGGDMEKFLDGIFLSADITYKCGDMTTVSNMKTTTEIKTTEE